MLENWLKPLPAAWWKKTEKLPEQAFGRSIVPYRDAIPDLKKVKIALIGTGEKEAAPLREALYKTVGIFPEGKIADLGNLRKEEDSFLIPVIYELLSGKVLPIILASDDSLAKAQFLAYRETKNLVNLAVIDEKIRWDAYGPLFQPLHPQLFHAGAVGLQAHQTPPEHFAFFEKHHFDTLRLGRSRNALEETEPVIRDADLTAFHLNALKQSEAPGVDAPTPSGFFVEEACQLSRYAGMSDKLTSFGVYGYKPQADRDGQTAAVAAQIVWYFMEGFFNRKNDYPASTAGLTEYVVDFRKLHYQITFWKSVKSGRWWMQVPVATRKKHERHRLIPCSYADYQAACREDLPERLLTALRRF